MLPAYGSAAPPRPAVFEVAGSLEPAPTGLAVRLRLRNVGGQAAEDVRVHGELLGGRASAEIPRTIEPAAAQHVVLSMPHVVPTAGVHALALRLDYDSVASRDHADPLSQWAYLLLAFGSDHAPALEVELPPARFAETMHIPVKVRSLDGKAHRVQLSLYVPRSLAAVPHRQIVEVPAKGEAQAYVRLFRALAAPRTTHGLLALAATQDEDVARTSAAVGLAEVGADPAVMPRAGGALLGAAAALALASGVAQWRRH